MKDGRLPLDGAHGNAVSIAFLLNSEFPNGIPGVHLTGDNLNLADAQTENSILDRWAKVAGFGGPMARFDKGVVMSTRLGASIDFRRGSFEESLIAGFSWWEDQFRWVTGDASVRLRRESGALVVTAYAPIDELRRKLPGFKAIDVAVEIDGSPAGRFSINRTALLQYRIDIPHRFTTTGDLSVVSLRPDFIWHGRDMDPRSLDDRDLSFALQAIGFEGAGCTPPAAAPALLDRASPD
jgi:hypothetical protein